MSPFEWDEQKNRINQQKHGVSFEEAQAAFTDPNRIIARDKKHSLGEERFYCIGKIKAGIIFIRFTYRSRCIRIIGAGFWRAGKKLYEKKKNNLYR